MTDDIAGFQHRGAERDGGLWKEVVDPPSDHHLHELGCIGVGDVARPDIGAVAKHRNTVADGENLVQTVTDVNDADAAGPQPPHDVEEPRDVTFGQRRGRLVHDEDARVVRQRAQDLDSLAVADRQRADDLVCGQIIDLERGEERFGPGAHGAPVDAAHSGARRVTEKNVLRDRQLGEEQQFLINRGDASALGVLWTGEARFSATDQNGAAVGLVDPGNDLDERRFAGPVLSEEGMDLPRADFERHARQRSHARKCLLDIAHFEERRGRVGRRVGLQRRAHAASVARGSALTTIVSTPASRSMASASAGAA